MAGSRQACDRATKRPLHAVAAALPIRLACGAPGRGRQIVRTVRPVHARDLSQGRGGHETVRTVGLEQRQSDSQVCPARCTYWLHHLSSDGATSWGFELMPVCIVICEKEGWSCGVS